MFKKSLTVALLFGAGISALSSSAFAGTSVYGSWSNGVGDQSTLGIFFYETSYAYHDESNTHGTSQAYSYDSLYGYLAGNYHSIFYLYPYGYGNVNWSNGQNTSHSISYSASSSFLGSSQPAPAWTSCGTNCVQGTKNWSYDKDLYSATYNISLCGIPLTFSAHVQGYANASMFSKAYSYSSGSSYPMVQGASTSLTGTAGLYGSFQGGIGWDQLASFSIGVTIDMINGSLPNSAYTVATCNSSGYTSRSTRSKGSINVGAGGGWFYVEGCLLYACEQWTLTSWDGWSNSYNLWDTGVVSNSYQLW